MKSLLIYLLAFTLIATQFSCKKNDSNPVVDNANAGVYLWPLNTANNWIFKTIVYDTVGAVKFTSYDTILVGRDTTISSQKWFQAMDKNVFWTNKTDGVWQIDFGGSNQTAQLLFKFPGNVGDNWTTRDGQASIVSTNASISLSSSTYTCYEYTSDYGLGHTENDYFKSGVGPILIEEFTKTNSGLQYKVYRRELISYTLK